MRQNFKFIRPTLVTIACYCLTTFAAADTTRHSAVVFMYHHFGVEQYPTTNVSRDQFSAHLDHLATTGYQVLPLEHIIKQLQQGKTLPDRTVAISIDDAYTSVYTTAWPLLRQRGWPFTVFVSTEVIDQGHSAYITWEQMREMQQSGVSFANHSRRHNHLIERLADEDDQAWTLRVTTDIDYAQYRLHQELGTAPPLFAYPYGEYSVELKQIVKQQGYVAFGQHSGAIAINPQTDRQQLPRFPMAGRYAEITDFITKAAALPLPVISATPDNPMTNNSQPLLTITLDNRQVSSTLTQQIHCYISGQGETGVQWKTADMLQIKAESPLAPGRNRYNCTAPSAQNGRYFWFSRLWIVAPPEQ